MATAVVTTMR